MINTLFENEVHQDGRLSIVIGVLFDIRTTCTYGKL